MSTRAIYAIAGLIIGAALDLLINLIAAAVQQKLFAEQFSNQSLWWLVGLALLFGLVGLWLGGKITVPDPAAPPLPKGKPEEIKITRLQALFSYATLKGKGITLSDILLVGSRIEIDTTE